mmetsp:Transcript_19258/g.49020  ORF Transcript_19258/g.49020 Transcript_19258/m.49020 type:complete len:402 (-) Transcript_19258:800-2005(-)
MPPAAQSPQSANQSTAASFMGAISSLMGYGSTSPRSSASAQQPLSADAGTGRAYDPIDALLPATLLDPYHPSPNSKKLNPAAPSFQASGAAVAAAAAAAAQVQSQSQSQLHAHNDPLVHVMQQQRTLFTTHPQSRLGAASNASTATSPTSPGSAYSNQGSMGAPGLINNPFRGAQISSAPLTGLRTSQLVAGALAANQQQASNTTATTPMRSSITGLANSALDAPGLNRISLPAEQPAAANSFFAHQPTAAAAAGSNSATSGGGSLTTTSASALSGFNMFAGSSVWSPSATSGDNGLGGWGAVPSGVSGSRGAGATWGSLGLPAVSPLGGHHTTATFGTTLSGDMGGAMLGLGASGSTTAATNAILSSLGAGDDDLASGFSADADLQANPWAQDIMRNVVD